MFQFPIIFKIISDANRKVHLNVDEKNEWFADYPIGSYENPP